MQPERLSPVRSSLAYLRTILYDTVRRCLNNEYVDYEPVIEHIACALYKATRSDQFFVYDKVLRRLDSPRKMIEHAEKLSRLGDHAAEYATRIRSGDFSLLMLGMFPQSKDVMRVGPGILKDFGRYSYLRADMIEGTIFPKSTDTFEAMADFFPRSVAALNTMFAGGELIRTDADMQSWVQAAESLEGG